MDKHHPVPKIGDLRVWHICQVGRVNSFYVPVASTDEAKKVLAVLADYDNFQYKNRIKPDYASASGLQQFEADDGTADLGATPTPGWLEWCDADGYDIDGR